MPDDALTIDQWIAARLSAAAPRQQDSLKAFQMDWTEGFTQNPLLFPRALSPADWEQNLAWYLEMDRLIPETGERTEPCAPQNASKAGSPAKPQQDATAAMDAALETLVLAMDAAPPGKKAVVPPAARPPDHRVPQKSGAEAPAPPEAAARKTKTETPSVKASGTDMDLDLGDLDTMEWEK